MTKLNVVIPAVNVMVEIGGSNVEFRKVDRKAQAGDIVKATAWNADITVGQFYAVYVDTSDGVYVLDDAEDRNWSLKHYPRDYEVYEALTPVFAEVAAELTAEITFEGAQYRKVDRSAREGDVIVITEPDDAEYTADEGIALGQPYLVARLDYADDPQITNTRGKEYDTAGDSFDVYEKVSARYHEVKRKATVGERIKIVDAHYAGTPPLYTNGDELVVVSAGDRSVYGEGINIFIRHAEYVVLEPVNAQAKAQPERLTVGDYAKIIADAAGLAKIGAIIKITKDRADNSAPYDGEYADGTATPVYFRESELEAATEAEFLAQRKPAEPKFYVGDSVKLTIAEGKSPHYGRGSVKNGDVGTITATFSDRISVDFPKQRRWSAKPEELTKLSAEEAAAIEKEAQEIAKWNAIGRKVGEFKRGDIVEAKRQLGAGERIYGEVVDVSEEDADALGVHPLGTNDYRAVFTEGATLIVPVEQRFDTAA